MPPEASRGLQRPLEASGGPPGADFLRTAPNEIGGQEFSPGFPGFPGSGVRKCGSGPPFHAQESQDDVSSQANSLKQATHARCVPDGTKRNLHWLLLTRCRRN